MSFDFFFPLFARHLLSCIEITLKLMMHLQLNMQLEPKKRKNCVRHREVEERLPLDNIPTLVSPIRELLKSRFGGNHVELYTSPIKKKRKGIVRFRVYSM